MWDNYKVTLPSKVTLLKRFLLSPTLKTSDQIQNRKHFWTLIENMSDFQYLQYLWIQFNVITYKQATAKVVILFNAKYYTSIQSK